MYDFLYQMNDQELADRILSYINRTEALKKLASDIIDMGNNDIGKKSIMAEYKELKYAIKADSKEVQRKEFDKLKFIDSVKNDFAWSIMESAAYGLTT